MTPAHRKIVKKNAKQVAYLLTLDLVASSSSVQQMADFARPEIEKAIVLAYQRGFDDAKLIRQEAP